METQLQNQAKTPLHSSVTPVQTGLFQSRPFTEPEQEAAEVLDSSKQSPNLQAKIDTAAQLGHNFSRVQVQSHTPAVMQPQSLIAQPEEQQDEWEAGGISEQVKLLAPPLGKPIQRQVEEDEPIQTMPQVGFLNAVMQRQAEEDEPLQMMPQLGSLPQESDEESLQMLPQMRLIQRQELEDDDAPQIPQIQLKVVVGQPGDKYEQEADNVAAQVMSMSVPPANSVPIQRQEEEEEQEPLVQKSSLADAITPLVQRLSEEQEEPIQTKSLLQRAAKSNAEAGSNVENQLNSSKGGGSPLPDEVRSFMEPRFGVDFSAVRVHTGSSAVQMNKELHAQAFTHGSDIYYGSGKSAAQDALTAHELTHVVQQTGGVRLNREVQRQAKVEDEQEPLQAKELPDSQGKVNLNNTVQPAETLVAKALPGHTSQLSLNKEVRLKPEATAEETEAQPIQAKQYTSLNVSAVSPRIQGDFLGIPTSVEEAKRKILSPVAQLASRLPGYPLLTVILGKDPINEIPVERNATNLIRGVLSLVPKGQEFFDNLQKSGAIDKAYNWFNEQIAKLNLTWEAIKGLFKRAWDSLGAGDIINPGGAFEKIKNVFLEPIGRIKSFAVNAGTKVMEFVFEGVMGGGGAKVMEIIRRAGGVFNTIISDPIKFIGNLVGALKGGFQQFSGNILNHLKNGLVGWLFGALAGAGLMLPAQFDLKGIVSLVLQVLGITYQRLRGMLVKMIGEPKVAKLEKVFDFLMMIVTQGLGAAWQKITEFAGGLQEMVMGGIREWVQNSIITAAITKLLSMFNPAGAVIQAVMAIYNTIMFFIERGPQIAAVAEAVFASIGSIAGGNIAAAANYVEQTMGRTLPVVISFLARLIGLGGISEHIKNVIKKIQSPIETAMTKVANFIVQKGKSLLGKDSGTDTGNADPKKAQKVREGLTALETEEKKYVDENDAITKEGAKQAATNTKKQHPIFQSITVISKDDRWDYDYVVQKTEEQGKKKRSTPEEDLQLAKTNFGNRRFKPREIIDFLCSKGLSQTTSERRVRTWKDDGVLFAYESTNKDGNKDFSFDRNSIPSGVRPVRPSNRSTYGYSNPDNTSKEGLEIIRKSLIKEPDPTSPTGYKYGYAPGKENDLNYLQTQARFECKRTSKILKWGEFHKGHHPEGASEHWNRIGHTKTKQLNHDWNYNPANYWGVEDARTSQGTGGGTEGYLTPGPPDHPDSHPMWWDPNHSDYAGNK